MTEKIITRPFSCLTIKGSSYDAGYMQGQIIKDDAKAMKFFTSGSFKEEKSGFDTPEDVIDFYESYIPGIKDELEGFSDATGISLGNLIPLDFPNSVNNCNHIAFLPTITENSRTYVTRTYDWNFDDEDMRLLKTEVDGKYHHLGFSTLLTGRTDGLNSQGLCVTMAGGGAWDYLPKNKRAINFSFAIRTLLDSCSTTTQAIDLLLSIPTNTSTNYLIADKSGKAAIVEGIDCEYAVRELDDSEDTGFLSSTNYYESEKMKHYNKYVNTYLKSMNKVREEVIHKFISDNRPNITQKKLNELLSKDKPAGICAPYYSEWFGNLWSMIFDVANGSIEICFGTPEVNSWRQFKVNSFIETELINANFIDKKSGFS